MPVRPAIEVEGLDELRKQLRRAKDSELNASMKRLHADLADEITRRALPKVPVKTGRLLKSVRSSGTVRDAIGRAGRKSVPYAPPIHWGWKRRGIKARPFLREAAQEIERDVVERYEDAVSRMLDRVVRGR